MPGRLGVPVDVGAVDGPEGAQRPRVVVGVGHGGGGGQGVVGLPFHHVPGRKTARHQGFFHHRDLVQQDWVHPLAGLVTGVQIVAKTLDDVVAGHPYMGGAGRDQLQGAGNHAYCRIVGAGIAMATHLPKMLSKQLVGPIDQVYPHLATVSEQQCLKRWARWPDNSNVAKVKLRSGIAAPMGSFV